MHQSVLLQKLKTEQIHSVQKLYRAKLDGCVAHTGTAFQLQSCTVVAHITPGNQVHLTTIEAFSLGQKAICNLFITNGLEAIKNRCLHALNVGETYSVFNNCEHLASYLIEGVYKSEQLRNALVGSAIGCGASLLLTKNKLPGTILCSALMGFIFLQLTKNDLLSN